MAFPVRRCALVGRLSDPRVAESVAALLPHLSARQVQVIVGEDAPLGQTGKHVLRVAEREIGAHADLVIAIGGGGTPLYAAGLGARPGGPVLGGNPRPPRVLTDLLPPDKVVCGGAAPP